MIGYTLACDGTGLGTGTGFLCPGLVGPRTGLMDVDASSDFPA